LIKLRNKRVEGNRQSMFGFETVYFEETESTTRKNIISVNKKIIILFCFFSYIPFVFNLFAAKIDRTRPVTNLLKGEKPFEKLDFNVGATGFRGWCFHRGTNSSESRQILVKSIDEGSPAHGQLKVGDVILGANGLGKTPEPFIKDARWSIADAINLAEARDPATLNLLRWRNGGTTIVTLTLKTMGAYSDSAPYNCTKSKTILTRGIKAFYDNDDIGSWGLGILALLAANDPSNPDNERYQAKAREWAHSLIKPPEEIVKRPGKAAWNDSYTLIILSEYYLHTKDEKVLPTLKGYAKVYSNHQSWFGTTGHRYAEAAPDGNTNGAIPGYGAINGSGIAGYLGMLLSREAGVDFPELHTAITRSEIFFASYVGKSGIAYGEHSYGTGGGMWDMNGKHGTAALAFLLQEDRPKEAKYYAKLTTASSTNRQASHAGPFFNYMWPPLGAAAVGDKAVSHYFKRTRWLYDLERKWDGTIAYSHYGNGNSYRGFPAVLANLLIYSLPLRQLHITGRDHNKKLWLSDSELAAVISAEDFDATTLKDEELFVAISNWSPQVRKAVRTEIAKRAKDSKDPSVLIDRLHGIVKNTKSTPFIRGSVCLLLGDLRSAGSIPILVDLLRSEESYLRFASAHSLRYLDRAIVMTHLNVILDACAKTAKPTFPLREGDPLQFGNHQIAMLLFYGGRAYGPQGLLANGFEGVDRKLLWPAVRTVANLPVGQGRSTVGSIYKHLTKEEVFELAGTIVESIKYPAPADAMFASGIRKQGIDILQKYSIEEGVSLCKDLTDRMSKVSTEVLLRYGGSVARANPNFDFKEFLYDKWMVDGTDLSKVVEELTKGKGSKPLIPLKTIHKIVVDDTIVANEKRQVSLKVDATNYSQSDERKTIYSWRKVYGAGDVKFTPNKTWDSKDTNVEFMGSMSEKYCFEVTMSDTLGYSSVKKTIEVTLLEKKRWSNREGGLNVNQPPVANSQNIKVLSGLSSSIALTGSDLDDELLTHIVEEHPQHGKLSGQPPKLQYKSRIGYKGKDEMKFKVVDGRGVSAIGTINIKVEASSVGCTLYEGFNYSEQALLSKKPKATAVGLVGEWQSKFTLNSEGSFSYAGFPVSGKTLTGRQRTSCALDKKSFIRDGLLLDGSELWFSLYIGHKGTNLTNLRFIFGLREGSKDSTNSAGLMIRNGGQFFGMLAAQPGSTRMGYRKGNVIFKTETPHLIVGRCVWGKSKNVDDVVEIYRLIDIPNQDPILLKKPVSVMNGRIDQEKLDTMYFNYNGNLKLDELRMGPTYESVLLGTVPLSE